VVHAVVGLGDDMKVQGFLRLDVLVQTALRDAGRFYNAIQRRMLEVLSREFTKTGLEDAVAFFRFEVKERRFQRDLQKNRLTSRFSCKPV